MPEYRLSGEGWVLRMADQARIPFAEGNPDYQDYLAWLAAGGVPLPAATPVPEAVEALQALLALDAAGLAPAFAAWAQSPERSFAERAFIDRARTWRRDNPVLIAGAADMGITPEQLDQLFIAGAAIQL